MDRYIFFILVLLLLITQGVGDFVAIAQDIPAQEENSVRLMSYNVRNAWGLDNKTDYQRVADVINRVDPDIIAVQELDSVTGRSGGVDVLDILSRKTLMYPTYAAAIDYDGGKYGVGILSKEKPISVKKVPLPGREEARMLLIVELEEYYFGNTHFSLNAEDRLRSVEIIRNEVERLNPGKPFFLAGDMNAKPDSEEQKVLTESFRPLVSSEQYTFPADNPDRCIDYIYGYNGVEGWSLLTGRGVVAEKVASDHRPLFADVRLHAEKERIKRKATRSINCE